ncbi:Ig-like domain-containing protein [Geobacter anodireducens]|uniref:Ig-like domain-containing protein n=1 Tax=Geobacter soli TaxID=1510391 RepID=UPI000AAF1277|nr:Ig-like domain-containing protein [Geobacter soli]
MIKHCLMSIFVIIFFNGCILNNNLINIAKLSVEVVDEYGNPIKNAAVTVSSYTGVGGKKENSVNGYTDDNGKYSVTLSGTNEYSLTATKDNYYFNGLGYTFKRVKFKFWQPWNPQVKIVLYKIGNLVPMYARNTEYSKIEIPVIGKKVGFDLIEFDWVPPYGKGVYPDMIFKLDKEYTDRNNFSSKLTVLFPNKYDGIQLLAQKRRIGSGLKLSRSAPEEGYQSEISHFVKKAPSTSLKSSFCEDNNYYFRIRSEINTNGKLFRAMYGKIYGDIVFEPRDKKTATILFKYFLNPDYTRNMEFDHKRNLFTGLSDIERNSLQ